ncbi:MAG: hypothetical protein K5739_08105 [Lachnospiraceae bacterium]|nr:hypothetical protein [Lachnospiraceae bacterium]
MHVKTTASAEAGMGCHKDDELIDTLTAISVVAKHLARKLKALSETENLHMEGGQSDGKNERTVPGSG